MKFDSCRLHFEFALSTATLPIILRPLPDPVILFHSGAELFIESTLLLI